MSEQPDGDAVSASLSGLPTGLLKIGAVARRFSVTPQAVREWVKEGRLPCYISPGGTRLFDPAEVARFAATWRRPQRTYATIPLRTPTATREELSQ